ncbi:MAG: hypothetical protein JXR37_26385 [Kiritimatiellae bacterium]|nr:hypothetical protein [Kiritimatiellia bacterium]
MRRVVLARGAERGSGFRPRVEAAYAACRKTGKKAALGAQVFVRKSSGTSIGGSTGGGGAIGGGGGCIF